MAGNTPAADWRDGGAYTSLLCADRSAFAWEWLRRSKKYRESYRHDRPASEFGLARLEDPDSAFADARPTWLAEISTAVLQCRVGAGDPIDWVELAWPLTVADGAGLQHLLLSDGYRQIRIDVIGGDGNQIFAPLFELSGLGGLTPQLDALDRVRHLVSGTIGPPAPASRRAGRWVETLRVHDALVARASYREIAAALYGEQTIGPRWWLDTPSWGLRIQRLAAASRAALAAGPRPWFGS